MQKKCFSFLSHSVRRITKGGFTPLETGHRRRPSGVSDTLSLTGFTLMELVLVVIIIGILSAMVFPRLAGRSEDARRQAAKSDIDLGLASAFDLYEMDMGKYSDSLEALRTKPADADNWRGPYIKKNAIDPWGRSYIYKFPGEHNTNGYDLATWGRDGKEGGGDDITSWQE